MKWINILNLNTWIYFGQCCILSLPETCLKFYIWGLDSFKCAGQNSSNICVSLCSWNSMEICRRVPPPPQSTERRAVFWAVLCLSPIALVWTVVLHQCPGHNTALHVPWSPVRFPWLCVSNISIRRPFRSSLHLSFCQHSALLWITQCVEDCRSSFEGNRGDTVYHP